MTSPDTSPQTEQTLGGDPTQGPVVPTEQADPNRFGVTLDGSVPLDFGIRVAETIANLAPRVSPELQARLATHPNLSDLTEADRNEFAAAARAARAEADEKALRQVVTEFAESLTRDSLI